MNGPIRDMAGLIEAMKRACEQRNITYATAGAIAGVADGYVEKLFAHKPMKNLGYQSTGELLGALGKMLVMVDDPDRIERVKGRWLPRKRIQKVPLSIALSIAPIIQETPENQRKLRMQELGRIGGKKRMETMSERARRRVASHAARKRWAVEQEASRFKDGKGKERKHARDHHEG